MLFTRERPRASAIALPAPAPLPILTSAFSRRAAIFGAVTVAALPKPARAVSLIKFDEATDAGLTAMAVEVDRTLDGAAYALAPDESADQDARLYHAEDLMRRMSETPAVGVAGLVAKAKAWLDSDSYDVQEGATLAESLCQDIQRLFANGSLT